jgi:hypothetical protein
MLFKNVATQATDFGVVGIHRIVQFQIKDLPRLESIGSKSSSGFYS